MNNKNDYLKVIYNKNLRPITNYPDKLISFLIKKYKIKVDEVILDLGCGRGDFLNSFSKKNHLSFGVDASSEYQRYFPEINVKICNLENELLPFKDGYFDVVFSKSVIEHFYYPEKIFKEVFRVLKPGGKVITLTPDWTYNYKIFYEDYTHRTPFTKDSLKDFFLINGFQEVEVDEFKQLPILWNENKFLKLASYLTRILIPNYFKKNSKWIKFSKEIMLLSLANK